MKKILYYKEFCSLFQLFSYLVHCTHYIRALLVNGNLVPFGVALVLTGRTTLFVEVLKPQAFLLALMLCAKLDLAHRQRCEIQARSQPAELPLPEFQLPGSCHRTWVSITL